MVQSNQSVCRIILALLTQLENAPTAANTQIVEGCPLHLHCHSTTHRHSSHSKKFEKLYQSIFGAKKLLFLNNNDVTMSLEESVAGFWIRNVRNIRARNGIIVYSNRFGWISSS